MNGYRNNQPELPSMDKTEHIVRKYFYDRPLDRQPPTIGYNRTQSSTTLAIQSQVSRLSGSSKAMSSSATVVGTQSSIATKLSTQSSLAATNKLSTDSLSQSMSKMFTNRELIQQLTDSNRDKELIESIDKKLATFTTQLTEMSGQCRDWPQRMDSIVRQCVAEEFDRRLSVMNDDLCRIRDENCSLQEELKWLKTRQLAESEANAQHQHCLDDQRRQLSAECLAEYKRAVETAIEANGDTSDRRIRQYMDTCFERLATRLTLQPPIDSQLHTLHIPLTTYTTTTSSGEDILMAATDDTDTGAGNADDIDWFDDIQ